jgi:hypothetical protein
VPLAASGCVDDRHRCEERNRRACDVSHAPRSFARPASSGTRSERQSSRGHPRARGHGAAQVQFERRVSASAVALHTDVERTPADAARTRRGGRKRPEAGVTAQPLSQGGAPAGPSPGWARTRRSRLPSSPRTWSRRGRLLLTRVEVRGVIGEVLRGRLAGLAGTTKAAREDLPGQLPAPYCRLAGPRLQAKGAHARCPRSPSPGL